MFVSSGVVPMILTVQRYRFFDYAPNFFVTFLLYLSRGQPKCNRYGMNLPILLRWQGLNEFSLYKMLFATHFFRFAQFLLYYRA